MARENAVDWAALKAAYASGGISYADLARAYDLPYDRVRGQGRRHDWAGARARAQAEDSAREKTRAPEEDGDRLLLLRETSDLFDRFMYDIMADKTLRETYITSVRDLRDFASALSGNESARRRLYDLAAPDKAEKSAETGVALLPAVMPGEGADGET